jgi:5'(3')-deoxyribonucleotidase
VAEERFCVGVDLDGVVGDFYKALHPLAAEWKGVQPQDLPMATQYDLAKAYDLDDYGPYEDLHRWAVVERDLFRVMPPVEGAPAALRRISARKIRIIIVTFRLFIPHFHRQAVNQTVEFLDHHGIPYWDLCFLRNKTLLNADLFVDDSKHNIDSLRAAGKDAVCLGNITNTDVAEPRFETWEAIESYIYAKHGLWLAAHNQVA